MPLTPAERLLQELGITEPNEIELDAIAHHVGACVRYRPLQGCEARIIGTGDRAIITVKSDSHPRRKRFSIAHELGHWYHHRGQFGVYLRLLGAKVPSSYGPSGDEMPDFLPK